MPPVDEQEVSWQFEDAWVLTAIAISPSPCSLTDVVAAADLLNHSILLDTEVESALQKLVGSGMVHVVTDSTFELTDDGAILVGRRRGSMFNQVHSVLSLLSAVNAGNYDFTLAPDAMHNAVAAYKRRTKR